MIESCAAVEVFEGGESPVGKLVYMDCPGGCLTGVVVSVRDDGKLVEVRIDDPAIPAADTFLVEARHLEYLI